MEIITDSEHLRYALQNAAKIKKDGKCIRCNGTGWVHWNGEIGGEIIPGENYDDPAMDNEECEKCDGVGYVW